jgi:fumarate reductase flavoprotein subunit
MDTIEGGKWLPDQDLAWTLVTRAIERVHELENELGCFFDRNPDGTVHQKAFAGQTFDRTVHKGDLTGIEIINRLAEQAWVSGARRLEEHRAVELVRRRRRRDRGRAGDRHAHRRARVRAGEERAARHRRRAHDVPLPHALGRQELRRPRDGAARGLTLRDMEMVQFHPTGLLAGTGTRMTGPCWRRACAARAVTSSTAPAALHGDYDPAGERATRDIVSRAIFAEMRAGRGTPHGGVYLAMSHLGRPRSRASSRAWSSAAPTAASTSPADWSRWCRRRTT